MRVIITTESIPDLQVFHDGITIYKQFLETDYLRLNSLYKSQYVFFRIAFLGCFEVIEEPQVIAHNLKSTLNLTGWSSEPDVIGRDG